LVNTVVEHRAETENFAMHRLADHQYAAPYEHRAETEAARVRDSITAKKTRNVFPTAAR
jgi:hypothetical protein